MISREESSKYVDLVKSLIGESVASISNSQYFFNGEKDDEGLGDLEILASSGLKVCLNLLSDGESVGAYAGDLQVPKSFEVAEGEQASWEKLALKQGVEVTGSKIVAIDAMYDFHTKFNSRVLAGWRVRLSSGDYFVFYNCGDNARFLFNELPNDSISDIETTWEPI